jgi:hypothetical protein
MDLVELTAEEDRLLAIVSRTTGSMEEMSQQLDNLGVFDAYRKVHMAYVDLAERDGNVEALKRAIFLQWFRLSEPSCFTGLLEFDTRAEQKALRLLDHLVITHQLDQELQWMLPWYYFITDFYLDHFEGFEEIKCFSKENQQELWADGAPTRDSLRNRGQMGEYWLSITMPRSAV